MRMLNVWSDRLSIQQECGSSRVPMAPRKAFTSFVRVFEPRAAPDGERRVKITCGAGLLLDDDNTCEKKQDKPVAMREFPPTKRDQTDQPRCPL